MCPWLRERDSHASRWPGSWWSGTNTRKGSWNCKRLFGGPKWSEPRGRNPRPSRKRAAAAATTGASGNCTFDFHDFVDNYYNFDFQLWQSVQRQWTYWWSDVTLHEGGGRSCRDNIERFDLGTKSDLAEDAQSRRARWRYLVSNLLCFKKGCILLIVLKPT